MDIYAQLIRPSAVLSISVSMVRIISANFRSSWRPRLTFSCCTPTALPVATPNTSRSRAGSFPHDDPVPRPSLLAPSFHVGAHELPRVPRPDGDNILPQSHLPPTNGPLGATIYLPASCASAALNAHISPAYFNI